MNLKALKAEIIKNGLTISQLADMIDLERKTLYHRMNGSIQFKLHEVVAIAKILKLSDDDIIRIFLKEG